MGDPRKHHYVPVFYQNKFANAQGLLWVYDRKLKTYDERHPKVICVETDLYAVKPEGAPSDQQIESVAMSSADGLFAAAVREIESGKTPPDPETIKAIAYFAGLQSTRLPSAARFVSSVYKWNAEESMRLMTVSVERMESVLEGYSRKTGEAIGVSAEKMVEAVRGKHIKVVVNEGPFLTFLFRHAEFLSTVFTRLSWEVLVASAETGFTLCDDPVVIVPPRGLTTVGISILGSVKYFPLTRKLCVRLGEVGQTFRFRNVNRQTVRLINQNVVANSTRFIMGPDREQLETVVARSGSVDMDSTPRFAMQTAQQDDNGSLQVITQNPRRYFYLGTASQAP